MQTEETSQVTIIGGGPVGLVLALYLDFYGVRTTIINTEPEARMHPKGNGQNARTMEHYRQLGFSDEVRKLGLPPDHPFDQAYFTRLSSHEVFRFPMPTLNERIEMRRSTPVDDQLPEPLFHVNQMYVEQYLLDRVRRAANVEVKFGWHVDYFTQDDFEVRVHAREASGERETVITSPYAVACDGGRGMVRKTLGIAYEGDVKNNDAYWAGLFYSIHMRIPDLYPKHVGERRAWMYWALNPDPDTRGVMIALNGKGEFMMLIKPRGGKHDVDEREVAEWVRKSIGADIDVQVLGHYPWNAGQALVAERYKAGRILLAGDAAHLFTPSGGFGMNTGIDDTSNLAWKLAAVLQGWGGNRLLTSYEQERKPIGYRNTGAARCYAMAMHDAKIPDDIEAEGPAGEAARLEASQMSYVRKNHFVRPEEEDGVGVQLGGRYDGSPVIVVDGEPPEDVFPDTYDRYVPSGLPGGRAPHVWLDDRRIVGSSLFDHFGKGFTLLRLDSSAQDPTPLQRAADALRVPLTVLDIAVPEARRLYGRSMALIRPDQYLAWRGDTLPDDCAALLSKVTGRD